MDLGRQASGLAGRGVIFVADSDARALRLARAAAVFFPDLQVLDLPAWDCLPYDRLSPSPAVTGRRIATLRRLAAPLSGAGRLLLTTADAALQRLPGADEPCVAEAYPLAAGRPLDPEALRRWLIRAGYVLDDRVDEPGEAALRGDIVDLFPADRDRPCRVRLGDDGRVAGIDRYDPASQRTLSAEEALLLIAVSEAMPPVDDPPSEGGDGAPERTAGREHWLPLAAGRMTTVFELLPDAPVILDADIDERVAGWLEQVRDGYEHRRSLLSADVAGDVRRAPLPPERLYLNEHEWSAALAARPVEELVVEESDGDDGSDPATEENDREALPRYFEAASPEAAFSRFAREAVSAGERLVLAGDQPRRRQRLVALAERAADRPVVTVHSWAEVESLPAGTVAVLPVALDAGFRAAGVCVVCPPDVFGPSPPETVGPPAAAFDDGVLRPGDLVVHADYGLCRLLGLERVVEPEGAAHECLAVQFAAGRRLLVPADEIGRIWRYGGGDAPVAPDRLDADAWMRHRAEIETEMARATAELVRRVRAREQAAAPRLSAPAVALRRFAARFRFTPTPDQARAAEEVIADLGRGRPMNRLVCGDVGFGKTEVALRAAAVAAFSGRQVALIAPTTVLVRQHLETFRRRFAGFDVGVEALSGALPAAEARRLRDAISDGRVGIVVGTTSLASDRLAFHDLGLVVVDEEQGFGEREKERLRELRSGVHALAMTATPIPRTLQSALAGLVDLSVIRTPPLQRRPVRTTVVPFERRVVAEALRREHARGGQSFFVCPRIADLEPMRARLATMVPELDVRLVHGRMKADDVDRVMLAFADGGHDVLLTTNIVESGLDIPDANTMLVWRPDRFGLAELHQLRGRVGRGRARGAVYLLLDPRAKTTAGTARRLATLQALTAPGSGFAIGARDLELRGAGDLLGDAQAGHLHRLGAAFYAHLFQRALRRARGEAEEEHRRAELRLGLGFAIPEDWVEDPDVRIRLYRRIDALADDDDAQRFEDELADRFGPPPDEMRSVLARVRLSRRLGRAGVLRVEAGPRAVALTVAPDSDADGIARAARRATAAAVTRREDRLLVAMEDATPGERLAVLDRLVDAIETSRPARVATGGRSG